MPSEHRIISVAAGHELRVRRAPAAASRPGYVTVKATRRPIFEIEQRRWDEGRSA